MVASLTCVANSGLSGNETANLFSYICGQDNAACTGINANGTTGVYGAYSMCQASQQLSFVMNQYYLDHSKAATACDFGGMAKTQTGSTSSSCSALLNQAGTAGTGTVTSVPTGAGAGSSGTTSASSGSSASSTTSKAAAGSLTIPRFDTGMLQLGAYLVAAAMTGAGMILL